MDDRTGNESLINRDMTILDIVSRYGNTVEVFERYNEQAGECLCCMALFDTVSEAAKKYNINLGDLMSELHVAAKSAASDPHFLARQCIIHPKTRSTITMSFT